MAATLSLAEELPVQQGGVKLPSFAVSDPNRGHNINAKLILITFFKITRAVKCSSFTEPLKTVVYALESDGVIVHTYFCV